MAQKLSLVARMGAGIKAFGAGFGAGISTFQPYEGAGFSRKRPVIYGAHARDSRLDLNEATRVELLKLARHMYRNVGLIKGAVDSIATYSIGPGLRPQYRGADQDFGRLCEEYWRDVVVPSPEGYGADDLDRYAAGTFSIDRRGRRRVRHYDGKGKAANCRRPPRLRRR